MALTLSRALHVSRTSCIAFAGAGGKTTALFHLAREMPSPVIVTTTTHLGEWQTQWADKHIVSEAIKIEEIRKDKWDVLLVTGPVKDGKATPVNDKLLKWLYQYCKEQSIPFLIEADGSKQKPLKGWVDREPVIPEFVDTVVQVVGLSGLGKPLTEEYVHRAELFAGLGQLKIGETITTKALTRVLNHPNGGLKSIPKRAQKMLLLNQADTPLLQSSAHAITSSLRETYSPIIVASLKDNTIHAAHQPIAGIVLAAGASSRFGKPKQLLEWEGDTFVHTVTQTALRAGLSPVVVVTGAQAEQTENAVRDLNVKIAPNENWRSGQGSSIREGVASLPLSCGGAIFLLADQPQVTTTVIHALKEKHAEGLYPIVAPMVIDHRANPVLFDRVTFPDLLEIQGDTGGRAIFHKHRVEYLPWHDDSLLLDVDTPEQYQRLITRDES